MTNESVAQACHCHCIGKPCRVIESDGAPYMIRIFIDHFKGTTTYLHRFVADDGERWVHDHPFEAQSSVICGGYTEERLATLSHKGPITAMFSRDAAEYFRITSDTPYRIVEVQPDTWAVFTHGPHLDKGRGFLEWPDAAMRHHQPFKGYKRPITAMFTRVAGEHFCISSDTFHRIVSVRPDTWTVFTHGPHLEKGWGFLEWGKDSVRYHQPFKECDGEHWWQDPDCLRYPPPCILNDLTVEDKDNG